MGKTHIPEMWFFRPVLRALLLRQGWVWMISNMCRRNWSTQPVRRMSTKLQIYLCEQQIVLLPGHMTHADTPLSVTSSTWPGILPSHLHPTPAPKFEASQNVRGCDLKKQHCPYHSKWIAKKKNIQEHVFLNWAPWSSHVRINWGVSCEVSRSIQHPGFCFISTSLGAPRATPRKTGSWVTPEQMTASGLSDKKNKKVKETFCLKMSNFVAYWIGPWKTNMFIYT